MAIGAWRWMLRARKECEQVGDEEEQYSQRRAFVCSGQPFLSIACRPANITSHRSRHERLPSAFWDRPYRRWSSEHVPRCRN